MSDILEKQLKSCCYADLSNFDAITNTYHIPKYIKPQYKVGKCYIVRVAKELIKNIDSVAAANWNHGMSPQAEYYRAYVGKILGNMLYVDAIEFDYINRKDNINTFSGWFPIQNLELLEEA